MADLVIWDEYVEGVSKALEQETDYIETTLSTYLTLLKSIKEQAVMEGATAKALEEFILQVSKLKGKFSDAGVNGVVGCKAYIEAVDEADGDLYKKG